MVRASTTSTASAQVEGQSCGQAEAAIRIGSGVERTVWFMVGDRIVHRPAFVPQSAPLSLFGPDLAAAAYQAVHDHQYDKDNATSHPNSDEVWGCAAVEMLGDDIAHNPDHQSD